MEFFPELELGLLNGWLPLLVFYIIYGIILLIFPKEVVTRLYERSGWTRRMKITRLIGVLLIFSWFVIATLSPLMIDDPAFIIGGLIFLIGQICFVVALYNYKGTPLDQPVTKGLYKISRNPQHGSLFLSFLGISITIGSWLATILILIGIVLGDMRIRAEEKACLERYGDAYQKYMEEVARYFVII
jgi:protein-S-isoprenylcysteine O-methyltransferase Ste14